MTRLAGKYALITGGSSGIGLETAKQFLEEGAKVAITARSAEGLAKAKEYLGDNVLTLQSESGDSLAQQVLIDKLKQHWSRLDVLYINAGDVTHKPLEEWQEKDVDQVMNTNFKGPFFLIKACLDLLSPTASIVLCGTVSAHIGLSQSSVYAASKAALMSLSRTLSGELLSKGVRVNVLSPGPTYTPAFKKFGLPPEQEAKLFEDVKQLVPLGRMGEPIEIAKAAVFLASDESSYMIGNEVLVDGGVKNL